MYFGFNSLLNGTRKDSGYNIGSASRKWFEMVSSRCVDNLARRNAKLILRPALQKAMKRLEDEEASAKAKM
jgi:hypothetical protein